MLLCQSLGSPAAVPQHSGVVARPLVERGLRANVAIVDLLSDLTQSAIPTLKHGRFAIVLHQVTPNLLLHDVLRLLDGLLRDEADLRLDPLVFPWLASFLAKLHRHALCLLLFHDMPG